MRLIKFVGVLIFCFALAAVYQNVQAQTDAEALQPASPAEATKIGDLGSYFDEYSSYMQLNTALHSSETMHLPDVHIGGQGVGGVTFFNGTIVNETTNPETGGDQPVTFGDNVRIDGYMFRNAPGGADGMPLLSGDDFVPALDDMNSLGEEDRRWQYLYVSDNIYGSDIIHEGNLSVTNSPTENYFLGYAGNNRFTWLDVSDYDTIGNLSCSDGEIVVYDSSTTSWVCSSVADAIDGAIAGGDTIDATTIETHHHAGGSSSSTTINARIEHGNITVTNVQSGACEAGGNFAELGDATFDSTYDEDHLTITATFDMDATPAAGQSNHHIEIVKDCTVSGACSGFTAYGCPTGGGQVNWMAIGD